LGAILSGLSSNPQTQFKKAIPVSILA